MSQKQGKNTSKPREECIIEGCTGTQSEGYDRCCRHIECRTDGCTTYARNGNWYCISCQKKGFSESRMEKVDPNPPPGKDEIVEMDQKMDQKMYQREYYQHNKKRIRVQRREYYQRNKAHILESRKEYQEMNRELVRIRNREYYHRNKDRSFRKRKYYQRNKLYYPEPTNMPNQLQVPLGIYPLPTQPMSSSVGPLGPIISIPQILHTMPHAIGLANTFGYQRTPTFQDPQILRPEPLEIQDLLGLLGSPQPS